MSQQRSRRGRRRNSFEGQPLQQTNSNSPFTWQQQAIINSGGMSMSNPRHNQGESAFTKVGHRGRGRSTVGDGNKSPIRFRPLAVEDRIFHLSPTVDRPLNRGGGGGELQNLLGGLPNARQSNEGKPYQNLRTSQANNGLGTRQSQTLVDQAAEEEAIKLNSAVLRRIDSDFRKLHGTASQVAVYRFNPETQSWDKANTAGCLLLYERTSDPRYGLVVMNRMNANNFIQWFGSDAEVVLQMPHLLLRNVQDRSSLPVDGVQPIHCIWFYDTNDCLAAADILRKMGLKFEGESSEREQARYEKNDNFVERCQADGKALLQILQRNKKDKSENGGSGARIGI